MRKKISYYFDTKYINAFLKGLVCLKMNSEFYDNSTFLPPTISVFYLLKMLFVFELFSYDLSFIAINELFFITDNVY